MKGSDLTLFIRTRFILFYFLFFYDHLLFIPVLFKHAQKRPYTRAVKTTLIKHVIVRLELIDPFYNTE